MMIRTLLLISIALCGTINGTCQTKKAQIPCTDACCKNTKKSEKQHENNTTGAAVNDTTKKKSIRCKLTTPELQKRKADVLASLKAKVKKREELSDGYSYLFGSSDENIDEVTSFIKTERMCCDFFTFKVLIEDDKLWLSITGEDGVKGFITNEMGL